MEIINNIEQAIKKLWFLIIFVGYRLSIYLELKNDRKYKKGPILMSQSTLVSRTQTLIGLTLSLRM